jgi:hypothetical protein
MTEDSMFTVLKWEAEEWEWGAKEKNMVLNESGLTFLPFF